MHKLTCLRASRNCHATSFVDVVMGVRFFSVREPRKLCAMVLDAVVIACVEAILHSKRSQNSCWREGPRLVEKRADSTIIIAVSPCGMPITNITYLKKGIVFSVGSDP